jgi:pimeloyl-ACP methyl ester carboxylesterase
LVQIAAVREDPQAIVAALDGAATRHETPCGAGRMVWRSWGAGPPVVLLHGGHGAWSHWIRAIPIVAQHYAVLVPDMPGFGESASAPEPYTAESLAQILLGGIDAVLGADARFAVVGFSFGGVVGGALAKLAGDRTTRLVLVGSGGLGAPRGKMRELRNWRLIRDPAARREAHRENLSILMLHAPSRIDDLAVHLQALNTPRTRIKSRPISLTDSLRRSLEQVTAPVAAIWGDQDATAKGHFVEREQLLKQVKPGAEFALIPGAGHWVQYEAPEEFTETLLRILRAR